MKYRALFAFILLHLLANSALAQKQKHFVIVNKSYDKDLQNSLRLYESYEKFVIPHTTDFYLVVPQKDLKLFYQQLKNAKNRNIIKKLPIFLTDEEVYRKCGEHVYSKATNMTGWKGQQVVKMCFAKLNIADNYLTIDSDSYFTRTFNTNILFKNNVAKTYMPRKIAKNNKEIFRQKHPTYYNYIAAIKNIINYKPNDYNLLFSSFAMWSSFVLKDLEITINKNYNYDFADLINIVPYEMQWYAYFMHAKYQDKLYPLPSIFTIIDSDNSKAILRSCYPTKGFPWQYGLTFNNVKEKTYVNKCSVFRSFIKLSQKRIERFIHMIKGHNIRMD